MMFKEADGSRLSLGYKAPQYVYGEFQRIEEYYNLFSNSNNLKRPMSVFCDLGSGLGKPTLLVAAMFPVSQSIGIEYVPRLHHVALAQKHIFENVIAPRLEKPPQIIFQRNDVVRCSEQWLHSDVIFINCVTWLKKPLTRLKKFFEKMKPGTEIFTSNEFKSNYLHLTKEITCEANWGLKKFYLYEVRKQNYLC